MSDEVYSHYSSLITHVLNLHTTVDFLFTQDQREGVQQQAEPEDLPDQTNSIQLSGERHEV